MPRRTAHPNEDRLETIYRLVAESPHHGPSLRETVSYFNRMVEDKEAEKCNAEIARLDWSRCSSRVVLAVLSSTASMRDRLPARQPLLDHAWTLFGDRADEILRFM